MITVPPGFYDRGVSYALIQTGQVSVGTSSTRIVAHDDARLGCVITNTSGVTVIVGGDTTVALTNGHALLAGNSLTLVSPAELWGIVATGTATVTTLQEIVR